MFHFRTDWRERNWRLIHLQWQFMVQRRRDRVTWSGVCAYLARHQEDPVAPLEQELAAAWGDPSEPHIIAWPMFMRLARKPARAR